MTTRLPLETLTRSVAALGLALLCSGCLSTQMVEKGAKSHWVYSEQEGIRKVEGQPGYYALLPLTVPVDLVIYPMQIFFYGDSKDGILMAGSRPVSIP
jgi:hypothetical protein